MIPEADVRPSSLSKGCVCVSARARVRVRVRVTCRQSFHNMMQQLLMTRICHVPAVFPQHDAAGLPVAAVRACTNRTGLRLRTCEYDRQWQGRSSRRAVCVCGKADLGLRLRTCVCVRLGVYV